MEESYLGSIFGEAHSPRMSHIEKFYIDSPYFKGENGTFVEIGGGNGVIQSNTFFLEKMYKWGGFLIEGNSRLFKDLQKNRPNITTLNDVAGDSEKDVLFDEIIYNPSIPSSKYMGHSRISDKVGMFSSKRTSKPLSEILRSNGCYRKIDFLVIDVEDGCEQVLAGMDFDYFDVGFLAVEIPRALKRENEIKRSIIEKGYSFVKFFSAGPDFIFVKNELYQ